MSFNVQGAKGLTIPEGTVKTIHDKDNRLLWGAVGYNTKYAGDTFQQTYSGKNLLPPPEDFTQTVNGVTVKCENGEYTISGTSTANGSTGFKTTVKQYTIQSGDYWHYNNTLVSSQINVAMRFTDDTNGVFSMSRENRIEPLTSYVGKTISALHVNFTGGYTFNGTASPMILHNVSAASDFEPYVGGIPSPNPDYPQDINVVTGEQTVTVTGKNLFDGILESGYINGTTGQNASNDALIRDKNYIPVEELANYKFSCDNSNVTTVYVYEYKADKTYNLSSNKSVPLGSYLTTDAGTAFIRFRPSYMTTDTSIKFQVEKGTVATAYEPYQSQSYEVNLGKNLLNLEALATTGIVVSNGVATGTVRSFNAAYGTSSGVPVTFNAKRVAVSLKAYTDAETAGTNNGLKIRAIYKDGTGADIIAFTNDITTATYKTAVTSDAREIDKIAITYGNLPDNTWHITDFQIEAGDRATSYAPYKTPIELCKIGTYQDYIWKDGSDWKIHKEVGKVVLTGSASESWGYNSNDGVFVISDLVDYLRTGFVPISDYYTGQNISGYSQLQNMHIAFLRSSTSNRTVVKNTNYTSATDFKTWLGTHNTTVYYALATPTDTAITDETLISQLDAIEEWMTRYGYVGTVFGNLPIVIDRTTI